MRSPVDQEDTMSGGVVDSVPGQWEHIEKENVEHDSGFELETSLARVRPKKKSNRLKLV
jgi:hypothetical protein